MNWRQVLSFEPVEGDPNQLVKGSFEVAFSVSDMFRNWVGIDEDDIVQKGEPMALREAKQKLRKFRTVAPHVQLMEVGFLETDSGNYSHASAYFFVSIQGPRAEMIAFLLKIDSGLETEEEAAEVLEPVEPAPAPRRRRGSVLAFDVEHTPGDLTTIEAIEAMPIVGNAFHDSGLMKVIDQFVKGNHPLEEKIRALKKLDEVMGVEPTEITESDVREYIRSTSSVV
jgi:hypothetical protein